MPPSITQSKKKRITRNPLQHAKIAQLATETQKSGDSVDQGILDRIQKCLARAYHANSSEGEGKAALFLSQKLMSQHNVTQADLMLSDKTKSRYGGHSVVEIGRTDGDKVKRTVKEAFVVKLAHAMCTFFDCKLYTAEFSGCIEWTFYGISQNTVAAARAFEMTHNQISIRACEYKGGSPSTSYRLGIANGLVAMANREKKKELHAARRKELENSAVKTGEVEQPRQPSPSLMPSPSTSSADRLSPFCQEDEEMEDVDNCSDGEFDTNDGFELESGLQMDFSTKYIEVIDLCDDDDETINKLTKRDSEIINLGDIPEFNKGPDPEPDLSAAPEVPVKLENDAQSITDVSPWKSSMQLVQFQQTADQVATDYLVEQGIKLGRSKRRKPAAIRDGDAYREGQRDSLKIDPHRRHLGNIIEKSIVGYLIKDPADWPLCLGFSNFRKGLQHSLRLCIGCFSFP